MNQFSADASTPKRYDLAPGLAGIAYADGIVWVANNFNGDLYSLDPTLGGEAKPFHLQDGGGLEGVAVGGGYVWVADGLQNAALLRVDSSDRQRQAHPAARRSEGGRLQWRLDLGHHPRVSTK